MKKLIFTLFVLFGITAVSFAQEANEIAVSKGAKELASSKANGVYSFTMPSNITQEDIDKNSKYYTHYFTVEFNASSHTAKVNMIENTDKNRYVIARFLTACGVRFITVDNKNIDLTSFIDTYLK